MIEDIDKAHVCGLCGDVLEPVIGRKTRPLQWLHAEPGADHVAVPIRMLVR